MATLISSMQSGVWANSALARPGVVPFRSRRAVVRVAAAAQPRAERGAILDRRTVLASAAVFVAALPSAGALAAQPQALVKRYYEATEQLHRALHRALDINAEDSVATDQVALWRDEANSWVADYRKNISVGRKSYAETYAAINALQGHYTSRGPDAPLPTKVRALAEKKLEAAEASLKREKAKQAAVAGA